MQIKILDKIRKNTPDFVWDGLNDERATDAMIKIRKAYQLNQNCVDAITDVIGLLVLKEINLEQIKSVIQNDLSLNNKTAQKISLIILTEILYPIKNYFPGIGDEILKLGGEVPKQKPKKMNAQLLKREKEIEAMQEAEEREEKARMADTIINKTIGELIKKYPKVSEQIIGNQKAIKLKDMSLPMKPMIKYWLKDYQEKMDYAWHSNIDRAHYVYQDRNTKNMNEEERRQLNLVLKSFDEKITLPYSTRMKKIDFSKTN